MELFASSLDGDGLPVISLRSDPCSAPEDEITCQAADDVHIYRHSLPAGTYYAAVAATAQEIVALLGLQPHPEGGHFREIFRDAPAGGGRGAITSIYYLLAAGEVSAWHRVDAVDP